MTQAESEEVRISQPEVSILLVNASEGNGAIEGLKETFKDNPLCAVLEMASAKVTEKFLDGNNLEPRNAYVIVYVAGEGEVRQGTYELLRRIEQRGIRCTVVFECFNADDLKKAAFRSNIDAAFILEGAEEQSVWTTAVKSADSRISSILKRRSVTLEDCANEDGWLKVGSLVSVSAAVDPNNHHMPDFEYRAAGFRSLVPLDDSDFAVSFRETFFALSQFPLLANVPWNPLDMSSEKRPTLTDVIWGLKPDDDPAKKNYFADESNSGGRQRRGTTGKSPLRMTEAQQLLRDPQPPAANLGEPAGAYYEKWKESWKNKQPPLLLLEGETGVGKSMLAEYITFLLTPGQSLGGNVRSRERFVKYNAAGLTLKDFHHDLMGATAGVFTGVDVVVGLLTRAAHGVFFLDEVGEMSRDVQAALLTFLDTREIRPSGVSMSFKGFQHIIAATNRDLDKEVAHSTFRQDLLARFALRLTIPPLRERRDDYARFIDYLAQDPVVNPKDRADGNREVLAFNAESMAKLKKREYKNGNFRELALTVHAAIRSARRRLSRIVEPGDIPSERQFRSATNDSVESA